MTIRELAAELGKSKTYIVNVIDELGLKGDLAFVGNKYDVPAETADKIRQHINGKSSPTTDTDTAAMTALIEQLRAKDATIERLQAENIELVRTIQKHTLMLEERLPAKQEPIETEPETIGNENKGLWSRIFGR